MTSTTVDALKNLYVALGGTASDVADLNVIPDVINAIAELGSLKGATAVQVDENNNVTIETNGSIEFVSSEVNITAEEGDIALYTSGETGNVMANGKVVATTE